MVQMWTVLLNLKGKIYIIIILILLVTMAVIGGLWQWERIHTGKLENKVEELQGHVDSLMTQIATRDSVIEDQKKNMESIQVSMEEMQQIKERTRVIRKTIRELVYVPTGQACATSDKLGEEYAKVANAIGDFLLSGVRVAYLPDRTYNGKTAPKVLPKAVEAGDNSSSNGE